jgi:hypothetical protein
VPYCFEWIAIARADAAAEQRHAPLLPEKMHVAYLPKAKVLGLSKIPRIVDAFARWLSELGARTG